MPDGDVRLLLREMKTALACIPFAGIIQIRFAGIISATVKQHPDAIENKEIVLFFKNQLYQSAMLISILSMR
jgi:hypothetical protein